jgi:hypothetical protein
MNTATRAGLNTTSALERMPGNGETSTRYRSPRRFRSDRKLSATVLSQQLARRLMLQVMPAASSASR